MCFCVLTGPSAKLSNLMNQNPLIGFYRQNTEVNRMIEKRSTCLSHESSLDVFRE